MIDKIEKYLFSLSEKLIDWPITFSSSHIEIPTRKGPLLLNKYRNEIWFSSPLGPGKYLMKNEKFFNKKSGEELEEKIFSDLKKLQ